MQNYSIIRLASAIVLFSAINLFPFNFGYHFDLIRDVLKEEGLSVDATDLAVAGNAYTDFLAPSSANGADYLMDHQFILKSMCVAEMLHFGRLIDYENIQAYYRRLIYNTYKTIEKKIGQNDMVGIMMTIGVTMHAISDFYSHTTWIRMNLSSYCE